MYPPSEWTLASQAIKAQLPFMTEPPVGALVEGYKPKILTCDSFLYLASVLKTLKLRGTSFGLIANSALNAAGTGPLATARD